MIVSQEVLDAVDCEFPENWDGLRHVDFRQTLDAFTTGEEITVADDPFRKPSDCFMARVHPAALEVVDIRTLRGPGIRCFGTVAAHDCFVGLTWQYREQTDFEREANRCHHEWTQIFGSVDPYTKGRKLHDCIQKSIDV